MLNAVGELLTHRTHNTTAPRDHHRDAEYMIRDLVAFYGGQMLIVEREKKTKCQGGILVSRNVNPCQQGLAAQSCSDLISQDQRTTSTRLVPVWAGDSLQRVWSRLWIQPCDGFSAPRSGPSPFGRFTFALGH
jgi:hypothetical protein